MCWGAARFGPNLFTEDSKEYKQGIILSHEVGHSFQITHPEELVKSPKTGKMMETPGLLKMHDRLMHPINFGTTRIVFSEWETANKTRR